MNGPNHTSAPGSASQGHAERERERREVGASDLVVPCCAITRAQPFFRVGAWGVGSEGTGACVRGRFSGLYGSIIGVIGLFR
jgi:hypothetical protein